MSCPQELKDAVLRALDQAYELDGLVAERVTLELVDPLLYEPGKAPPAAMYKVVADATDARTIHLRITVRAPTPAVWPR